MFRVPSPVVALGLMLCLLPAHETMAQQFSANGVVYEAARNKIGLMRYCRNNALLNPAIADQAVAAVETGLSKLQPGDTFAREQGDRAQQAGEDGFWEAGRRRDIANVARLFRTTPADLCREWADETLRAQALRRPRGGTTIAVIAPAARPVEPPVQAGPTLVEPIQAEKQPPRATVVVKTARPAPPPPPPPPPLPEKAPLLPAEAETAALQRTLPTVGNLASTGIAASGQLGAAAAIAPTAMQQQSMGQTVPLSAQLAAEAAEPLPREEPVAAADPPPLYDQPPPPREKWPFNRLGRAERCLMPGCKWVPPQENRSWGY